MKKRKFLNKLALGLCLVSVLVALLPLVSIFVSILLKGIKSVNWAFFTQLPRPAGESGGGMANAITGTLLLIGLAACWSVPVGILTGIYLAEFGCGKFGEFVRLITDIIAGIPSIVVGILAYTVFVLPMKTFSAYAGGFALGIIMLPTVTRTTEEMIRMVPFSLREAAWALGMTPMRTIGHVVLKSAFSGIVTGVLLAVARAAGETAPLLFTAFGNMFWHHGLKQPVASLPLQIFNYAVSPYDDWQRQAWAGSLVLLMIVFVFSLIGYGLTRRSAGRTRG